MAPVAVFLLSLFIILPVLQNQYCIAVEDSLDHEQRQGLLDFIGNVSNYKLHWDSSKPACDNWKGVICDGSKKIVLYVRLPALSLVGNIPPNTIGKLKSLRVLSLHLNGFSGELPPDFSSLTSLTRIILNNNNFTGNIPSGLSDFKQLIRLSLNNNNFSGQLPYIESKELEKFDVSFNKLNSSIPHPLSMFPLSSFNVNVYLCGPPTNRTCNSSYDPSPYYIKPEKPPKQNHGTIAISVASGLVLLVLLCCVRKKVFDKQIKQQQYPVIKAPDGNTNNIMVFDSRVYRLDIEHLLKASAEVLGEGSVGTSYKQVIEGMNTTVVVKRLKDVVVVTENEFRKRMEDLGQMKNKNVVPLMGYYYSKDEKWLVYDYMPAGSLYDRLHGSIESGRTQLDWDHRMRIALSAARGLAYLHEDGKLVVHGNIKSLNILLQQETDNEASLSDYGLNTLFNESRSLDHHGRGYWAPEVNNTREVTFQSDVYSFGVLLLEILTSKYPDQESLVELELKEEDFDVKLRRGHNIEEMRQLLEIAKKCVSKEPDQRPKMHDVVNMMDDMWLRQSSDDRSKGYDDTPSTDTRDTPSTITP